MTNVVQICLTPDTVFTLLEVDKLIPLIQAVTYRHENLVMKFMRQQSYMIKTGAPEARIKELDTKVGKELVSYGTKMTKLGARVYGHGYSGFNSGFGYWSYHVSDGGSVQYYHDYNESPLIRRKLNRLPDGSQIG